MIVTRNPISFLAVLLVLGCGKGKEIPKVGGKTKPEVKAPEKVVDKTLDTAAPKKVKGPEEVEVKTPDTAAPKIESSDDLATAAAKVHSNIQNAFESADLDKWKANVSAFKIAKERNTFASRRQKLKAVFLSSVKYAVDLWPDLSQTKLLSVNQNPNTGSLVYRGNTRKAYRQSERGTIGTEDAFFVLVYVREGGRWKWHKADEIPAAKMPEVIARLEKKDMACLKEGKFAPPAEVPEPPETMGTINACGYLSEAGIKAGVSMALHHLTT